MSDRWSDKLPAISAVATSALVSILLLRWSINTGLWCDELLFLRAVELGPLGGLMTPGSSHPPLLRWLLAPWAHGSLPDWALRLPSILASIATIWVWKSVLQRLLPDRWSVSLLLPALALNVAWLAIAYQCVPYAMLTLLASLHVLAWLRWLEQPGRGWLALVVGTGVACAWTHFYGLNLLVADQFVWILLLIGRKATRRQWFGATLATGLLTLPLLPILLYYVDVERQVSILHIADYPAYFWQSSAELFSRTTFFGLRMTAPIWIGWFFLAALVLRTAWRHRSSQHRSSQHRSGPSGGIRPEHACRWSQASVVCGVFLAGLPAAQGHSVLSGEAMWERYTVSAMWLHWPLVALWLTWSWGPRWTRGLALALTITGLLVLRLGPEASPLFTHDYRPVVRQLRTEYRPGDVFLAQDIDIWTGERNFERLWFDRYMKLDMPLVTGAVKRRIALYERGLPLDELAPDIRRVWVHTLLFDDKWYRQTTIPGWRIERLAVHGDNYPLVLYVRDSRPPLVTDLTAPRRDLRFRWSCASTDGRHARKPEQGESRDGCCCDYGFGGPDRRGGNSFFSRQGPPDRRHRQRHAKSVFRRRRVHAVQPTAPGSLVAQLHAL